MHALFSVYLFSIRIPVSPPCNKDFVKRDELKVTLLLAITYVYRLRLYKCVHIFLTCTKLSVGLYVNLLELLCARYAHRLSYTKIKAQKDLLILTIMGEEKRNKKIACRCEF